MIQYEIYVKYNWIIESLNHWTIGNQFWSQLFKHRSFCMNGNIGNDEFIEIDWIVSIFELNWFLEVKSKSNQINVWFLDCMIILFDGILGWIDRYWYVNMIIIYRWVLKRGYSHFIHSKLWSMIAHIVLPAVLSLCDIFE